MHFINKQKKKSEKMQSDGDNKKKLEQLNHKL